MGSEAAATGSTIERAARGDQRAREALVDMLAPWLLARIRQTLAARSDRRGIEQLLSVKALLRLFAGLPSFTARRASIEAWASIVAESVVLQELASSHEVESIERDPSVTDAPSLDLAALDRGSLVLLVARMRECLPPLELSLFWAVYVEARDSAEVARDLKLDESALDLATKSLVKRVFAEARRIREAAIEGVT